MKLAARELNAAARVEEQAIQQCIFTAIDRLQSMVFNAGAGAGKTYALIQSLKHIVATQSKKLLVHNQKVTCITYTNVATAEIKSRLGNSELIQVSTIHDRLWTFLSPHQPQLVEIHGKYLIKQVDELNVSLTGAKNEEEFKAYDALDPQQKVGLKDYLIENKLVYQQNKNKSNKAKVLKALFQQATAQFGYKLTNVKNFQKVADIILKIDKYQSTQKNIVNKKTGFKKVHYKPTRNVDSLDKMLISHDTLLQYAAEMVAQHDVLKQIMIDTSPYFLIDEYQDTNQWVVKIMADLDKYADKINHRLFVGYFGDTAQSIYDDGVGHRLHEYHDGLLPINKPFNRRSHSEIITPINNIRNIKITDDETIAQRSIYDDSTGGSVKFYASGIDGNEQNREKHINSFIAKYRNQWQITQDNRLNCLVLGNKTVARLSGFADIFQTYGKTKVDSRQIKTELLSKDPEKLGQVPNCFYKILQLKAMFANPKNVLLSQLLSKNLATNLTFTQVKALIVQLQAITGNTFDEYLRALFTLYATAEADTVLKRTLDQYIESEHDSYETFYSFLLNTLFYNLDVDDEAKVTKANETITALLHIDIKQYVDWYNFVADKQDADTIYHTYHGTKGAEFDNVLIIMENDFGSKSKNKFSSFFTQIAQVGDIREADRDEFKSTQNLLYVACSRAIKNLRILYLDDTTSFMAGIQALFGEIH